MATATDHAMLEMMAFLSGKECFYVAPSGIEYRGLFEMQDKELIFQPDKTGQAYLDEKSRHGSDWYFKFTHRPDLIAEIAAELGFNLGDDDLDAHMIASDYREMVSNS